MLLLPRVEHRMRGWISFTKPQSPGRIHKTAPCEAKGVGKSETCLPSMSAVCYFTAYLAYSNVSLCRDNKKCDDARPCTRCKARSEACIHIERGPKNVKARCKRCREEDHKVSHIFCHHHSKNSHSSSPTHPPTKKTTTVRRPPAMPVLRRCRRTLHRHPPKRAGAWPAGQSSLHPLQERQNPM